MTTAKNLGIWMNHSSAHIMEFTSNLIETIIVKSKFKNKVKKIGLVVGGIEKHNNEQSKFYKKLGDAIIDCQEVVLFGPTDAKTELSNILKADNRFSKIRIEIRQTNKLTENQQKSFLRDYYLRH